MARTESAAVNQMSASVPGGVMIELGADSIVTGGNPGRYARRISPVILLGGFFGSLFVAFFSVLFVGPFLLRFDPQASGSRDIPHTEQAFPNSVVVNGPGVVVKVPETPGLNPVPGEDFLFYVWFKLRRSLDPDQRIVFVAKYDPNSRTRPGYSVGLVNGPEGVRPIVYWNDDAAAPPAGQNQNHWYTFSSTEIVPREWYMLAVSYHGSRYLGVHVVRGSEGKSISVLGGYDLGENSPPPSNDAELEIGSFAGGLFKGRLGPFGVLRGTLSDRNRIVKTIARSPLKIPSLSSGAEIVIWADGRNDLGPNALHIDAPPQKAHVRDED